MAPLGRVAVIRKTSNARVPFRNFNSGDVTSISVGRPPAASVPLETKCATSAATFVRLRQMIVHRGVRLVLAARRARRARGPALNGFGRFERRQTAERACVVATSGLLLSRFAKLDDSFAPQKQMIAHLRSAWVNLADLRVRAFKACKPTSVCSACGVGQTSAHECVAMSVDLASRFVKSVAT